MYTNCKCGRRLRVRELWNKISSAASIEVILSPITEALVGSELLSSLASRFNSVQLIPPFFITTLDRTVPMATLDETAVGDVNNFL